MESNQDVAIVVPNHLANSRSYQSLRFLDKLLLLRFLKVYDFDIEKAKELLLINLEMRQKNPNIFEKRDVLDENFQRAFRTFQIFPMPKNTIENHKISVFRLIDMNPENYIYIDVCRMVVSMMDARFVTVDANELVNGEIGVIDMTGFGFKHFLKSATNLSVMRNYMRYVQEAAPFKIVQNHFINCSPMMDRFMSLVKPFMKKEIIESMKFHTSLESLYDTLPRELLPNEFGGNAGSKLIYFSLNPESINFLAILIFNKDLDDFYSNWVKVIESKR